MSQFLLVVLRLLGYKKFNGVDSNRCAYVGFVKTRKNGMPDYFHVYHEGRNGTVIRPYTKEQTK